MLGVVAGDGKAGPGFIAPGIDLRLESGAVLGRLDHELLGRSRLPGLGRRFRAPRQDEAAEPPAVLRGRKDEEARIDGRRGEGDIETRARGIEAKSASIGDETRTASEGIRYTEALNALGRDSRKADAIAGAEGSSQLDSALEDDFHALRTLFYGPRRRGLGRPVGPDAVCRASTRKTDHEAGEVEAHRFRDAAGGATIGLGEGGAHGEAAEFLRKSRPPRELEQDEENEAADIKESEP